MPSTKPRETADRAPAKARSRVSASRASSFTKLSTSSSSASAGEGFVNADHFQPLAVIFVVKLEKLGHARDAWPTPVTPKIEHHDFAA